MFQMAEDGQADERIAIMPGQFHLPRIFPHNKKSEPLTNRPKVRISHVWWR